MGSSRSSRTYVESTIFKALKWTSVLSIQVTGKHTNKTAPTTVCEEDHKLATVCLIKRSGPRGSDSVQSKVVHFKIRLQHWVFVKTVYLVLRFVSFHLLDGFKFGGGVLSLGKTWKSHQANQQYAHTDVWLSVKVLPLQLDVKHRLQKSCSYCNSFVQCSDVITMHILFFLFYDFVMYIMRNPGKT